MSKNIQEKISNNIPNSLAQISSTLDVQKPQPISWAKQIKIRKYISLLCPNCGLKSAWLKGTLTYFPYSGEKIPK